MASIRSVPVNILNQENATVKINGKSASNKALQPTRRAALDDLGNKLANKLNQNGPIQKNQTLMGPPNNIPDGKKQEFSRKNVVAVNNKENSILTKKEPSFKCLEDKTKKMVRQESILAHTNRAAILRQEASAKVTHNTSKTTSLLKEVISVEKVQIKKDDSKHVEQKNRTKKVVEQKTERKSLLEKCREITIVDPDETSKKDPQMVTEYIEDILAYVRELEENYPIEEKFLNDSKVSPKMRSTLVNWLVDVHRNFSFENETLHLCISIVDRYLMVEKQVDRSIFQLVGTAALLLASKYEELYVPDLSDYVYICDGAFTRKQVVQMEMDILRKLDFRMGWPMSIYFLRRYSKIAQVRSDQHTLAKYILELALLEYGVAHIRPSIQAAAACCLSIAILTEIMEPAKLWTPTMVHYTTYKYSDIEQTLNNFAHLLKKTETSKYDAIKEKYAHAKFSKISQNFKLQGPLMRKLTSRTNCTF